MESSLATDRLEPEFWLQADPPQGPWPGVKYQVALRAIGQDLTGLLIESLDIAVEEKVFIVRCLCVGTSNDTVPESAERFFRRTWPSEASSAESGHKRSTGERFVLSYSAEVIKRLDELGLTQQTGALKTPDANSLAESLRTIGRAVDCRGGRLVRLSKLRGKITFVYQDKNGRAHSEEHYSLWLYRSQQEALSLRARQNKKDVWENCR